MTKSTESPVCAAKIQFWEGAAKIYRVRHRAPWRYEVRYHRSDGSLERSTFDDYAGAKEHAEKSCASWRTVAWI